MGSVQEVWEAAWGWGGGGGLQGRGSTLTVPFFAIYNTGSSDSEGKLKQSCFGLLQANDADNTYLSRAIVGSPVLSE